MTFGVAGILLSCGIFAVSVISYLSSLVFPGVLLIGALLRFLALSAVAFLVLVCGGVLALIAVVLNKVFAPKTESTNTDKAVSRSQQKWKHALMAVCALFSVGVLVIASMFFLLAGAYGIFSSESLTKCVGVLAIGIVACVCLAFGYFVFAAVATEGEEDPKTYRENTLEISKLFAALIGVIGALWAVLLMVLK